MNHIDELPGLREEELRVFRAFCELAVDTRSLLAPVETEDVTSNKELADLDRNEVVRSAVVLLEQGYLYRSGRARYTITPRAFETYAQCYIERYQAIDEAVREAVAAVESTDTDAIVASTGEPWYLVNHILRRLLRQREIEAFISASDRVHVTRVSASFKRQQAAPRLV